MGFALEEPKKKQGACIVVYLNRLPGVYKGEAYEGESALV